jgi:hypothetical protein
VLIEPKISCREISYPKGKESPITES